MKSQTHIGFWLLVFAVTIFLGPLFIEPRTAYDRLLSEVAATQQVFGPRIGGTLVNAANGIHGVFERAGVEEKIGTGVHSKDDLVHARQYFSFVGEAMAGAASQYVAGLLLQFYGVVMRFLIMLAWSMLLLPVIAAAVADGVYARKIHRANAMGQSPTAFAVGGHMFIVMTSVPMLYVALPVFVTPLFMPMWVGLMLLPLRLAITHTQPVFSR